MNKKGVIWNSLGSLMYGANSFIMLALVSRVGTVEQAGYFGIAFTTAQILYIVGLFGVPHFQMTDYGEKYRFSDYIHARRFSCLLMACGCAIAIWGFHFTGAKASYTVFLTALMLLNVIGELYQSLFFQKNRLDLSGSALFYRTLWPLLLFCIILWVTRSIIVALSVQILANLFLTIYYAVWVAPRFISAQPCDRASGQVQNLLMECFPLFVSLLLMNIVINASKYGIELMMNDLAQGYYNMIFMPAQVINLCSQFLFKPLLNRYSKLLSERQIRTFGILLLRQIVLIALLTCVCCAGAYAMGIPVLSLLYQKDISALRIHLILVVLGGGIFAVCQLYYYLFVILRGQEWTMKIYLCITVVAVPTTAVCVHSAGLMGAVLSFVILHAILALCYTARIYAVLRREFCA